MKEKNNNCKTKNNSSNKINLQTSNTSKTTNSLSSNENMVNLDVSLKTLLEVQLQHEKSLRINQSTTL